MPTTGEVIESRTVDRRVPFVGRTSELRRLQAFLKRGGFLTLVGPGGVGKSRLAYEAVSQFVEASLRDVAFVSLAGVEPEAVLGSVMHALSLREEQGQGQMQTLYRALRDRPLILVLDNCEHAPDQTSSLMESLRELPTITVLATSQRRLDYSNEEVLDVEPLALEDGIAFFNERARLQSAQIPAETRSTVAEIVRRLDALPVALDLAAARLASLSLDQLATELGELRPYQLRSTRGSDPRHRTIGNVIAWSHSRLSDGAKRCFAVGSLFADEFDVADMVAVAGFEESAANDWLEELAYDSLLMRTEFGYRMLSPIRAVAARSIATLPDRRAIEDLFAKRGNDVALELWSEFRGGHTGAAMRRLFLRYGDFCRVLTWALKRPAERFEQIANVLPVMIAAWAEGGRFSEGLAWCERLEIVAERLRPDLRGQVYYVGLCVSHAAGEFRRMVERAPATTSAFTIAGDKLGLARSYNALAAAAFNTGALDDAATYAETALRVYEQLGHTRGIATALINQGNVYFEGNDDAVRGNIAFRKALDLLEADGTDSLIGIALGNVAEVEYVRHEYDSSIANAQAAIAHFEAATSLAMIAWAHETIARACVARGHAPAAQEHLLVACDLLRRSPHPLYIARLAEVLARLLLFVRQNEEAALALSAARRIRRDRSLIRMGFIARETAHDEAAARDRLGQESAMRAAERAAGWDIEAITRFLSELLVGIGRSEPWRNLDIVGEPQPAK